MHAKPAMLVNALLAVAALGLALLPGGCVGVPRTFYAAEPAAPGRPVPPRSSRPPVPAAFPLSDSEKRRLFQDFQQSQSAKDQAATAQEPVP